VTRDRRWSGQPGQDISADASDTDRAEICALEMAREVPVIEDIPRKMGNSNLPHVLGGPSTARVPARDAIASSIDALVTVEVGNLTSIRWKMMMGKLLGEFRGEQRTWS
jgi:hypothetical protein